MLALLGLYRLVARCIEQVQDLWFTEGTSVHLDHRKLIHSDVHCYICIYVYVSICPYVACPVLVDSPLHVCTVVVLVMIPDLLQRSR